MNFGQILDRIKLDRNYLWYISNYQ